MNEQEMVEAGRRQLYQEGIEVALEVPFLNGRIDMVYSKCDGSLVAIEFKVNDWNKAIKQARDRQLGVDYSYICLPKHRITKSVIARIKTEDIGLFAYEKSSLCEIKPAKKSRVLWAVGKQRLMDKLS